MKALIIKINIIIALLISSFSFASNSKTETFKVWGNCGMCKKTIEKATRMDGVEKATWDVKTKQLKVTYNTSKTNLLAIQKNIAAAGYDNDGAKGDDKAYDKLHSCCQYDRK